MKCFAAAALLALFAVAFAEEASEEFLKKQQVFPQENIVPADAPRDKRGLLLSYTAPLTYSTYTAPLTYSAPSYTLPYAYRSYPHYYSSYYYG